MQKPNKLFSIGLVAVLIFVLALPQPIWAGLIPGPFDYFDMVSQNVEEVASPIMSRVITTFIFYALGLIVLRATANILDRVIIAQSEWLDLQSPIVQTGWHFTSGLANMLIILILIFIAFQIILKLDTVATKKALIKLFIVALLLNFSLLFIEIVLDITDVFYNSILNSVKLMPGGGSLLTSLVDILIGGTSKVIRNFTVMIGGWAVTSLIPGAGGIKQLIISLVFVGVYFPLIVGWMIEAAVFFVLSGIFLTWIFVFAARAYVIQILAILSPLAFIALILPQTEKYWKEWLDHLVQWLFAGIFLLFFLAIFCAGIGTAVPKEMSDPWIAAIPGLSWKGIRAQMMFYFLIIVYLGVLLFISKKAVPAIANEVMGLAKNIGGTVWSAGVKPLAGKIRYQGRKAALESSKIQDLAARESMVQTPQTGWKKVLAPGYALRRRLGQELGPGAAEARNKEIRAQEKKLAETENPVTFHAELVKARAKGDDDRILSVYAAAIGRGGAFKDTLTRDDQGNFINKDEAKGLARRANEMGLKSEAKAIAGAYIDKNMPKDEANALLVEMGFKDRNDPKFSQKDKEEWDAQGWETPMEKLVAEAKNQEEMKHFADGFWKSPAAAEAIDKFWGGHQISQASNEFGRRFLADFQNEANSKGIEWYEQNNPRLARYLSSSAAHGLGLETPPSTQKKYWVPPTPRPAPPSEEEIAKQKIMKEDLKSFRKEYQRLLRKTPGTRSTEEEETIKMLEHTIEDIKKRFNI